MSDTADARTAEEFAWAVWIADGSQQMCYAVTGDSEERARNRAIARHDGEVGTVDIDGPFRDCEPGVWEFEFVNEYRETVVVEAPHEDYAADRAGHERTHRGDYTRTVHTEARRLDVDPNRAAAADTEEGDP